VWFFGVTTNPVILKAAGVRLAQLPEFADRVLGLGAKEIFFQSWGQDGPLFYQHGMRLADISSKVVVKLPATREVWRLPQGFQAREIRTCITAVYSPFQRSWPPRQGQPMWPPTWDA